MSQREDNIKRIRVGRGPSDSARVLMWFRADLRVRDNPALYAAAQQGRVVPVFVYPLAANTHASALSYPGAAGQVWLHHSLTALQ
ncbi:MAG: deoxyribodipyrimidine photo-lyase, partial [Thermodesulfobacteriota bacterium]